MAAGRRTFKAWAVDTNSKQGHGYLGIYAFDTFTKTENWQDGCRLALFRTRDIANQELKKLKSTCHGYFPKSSVRRVVVTVEPIKGAIK